MTVSNHPSIAYHPSYYPSRHLPRFQLVVSECRAPQKLPYRRCTRLSAMPRYDRPILDYRMTRRRALLRPQCPCPPLKPYFRRFAFHRQAHLTFLVPTTTMVTRTSRPPMLSVEHWTLQAKWTRWPQCFATAKEHGTPVRAARLPFRQLYSTPELEHCV
jgi:hypothetical protein